MLSRWKTSSPARHALGPRDDQKPGHYAGTCKPGMVGDGISTTLMVAGESITTATDPKLEEAARTYQVWVAAQADELLTRTTEFVTAVKSGDVETAKSRYAVARAPWERIEPVAESFGDLDPAIDGREDVVAEGWSSPVSTGLRRTSGSTDQADSSAIADKLLADVTTIVARGQGRRPDGLKIANGAGELLDEMATGKITGEEDRYSHTDLADFAANWEGSRRGRRAAPGARLEEGGLPRRLRPGRRDPGRLIAEQKQGDGYARYDTVSTADIQVLPDALTAVSEQVGKIGAALAQQ